MDLLPYVPFNRVAVQDDVNTVNFGMPILDVSALNGTGIEAWCRFLEEQRCRMLGVSASVEISHG
jgi:hydrogenase nickel incorporation protein HypB